MRLSRLWIPFGLLASLGFACSDPPASREVASATPAASPTPAGTPAAGPSIQLNPVFPTDVAAGPNDTTLPTLQPDFDTFSWNSFIAAVWPPSGDPSQPPGSGSNGDNPTTWETWQDVTNVFLPNGQKPVWGSQGAVPAVCQAQFRPGLKVLSQVGKTPGLLGDSTEPFNTGPLVDQNNAYTRFQIVINKDMFDYIVNNGLYSQAGQTAFSGPVQFPCGPDGGHTGAVMVKAAWKILGAGDDPSHFHTSQALIYTPAVAGTPIQESCVAATVGLVGLHIAHKVDVASQWVWSTFEQTENVPTDTQVKDGTLSSHYNYFNPACTTCAANQAPPRPWVPNQASTPPSQVVRVSILPYFASNSAMAQNQTAQALLQSVNPQSVWRFYQLVSTQWPTNTGTCAPLPAAPLGTPFPQFLANTTLETYVQGMTPNVSSSCIGCHNNAAMTNGGASDFTYVLARAQ